MFAQQAAEQPHWSWRLAAVRSLATTVEGCAQKFAKDASSALGIVCRSLADTESTKVVACASLALGQFAQHMQNETRCLSHVVFPALYAAFDAAMARIGGATAVSKPSGAMHVMHDTLLNDLCYALDALCEAVDRRRMAPQLGPTCQRLGQLLALGNQVDAVGRLSGAAPAGSRHERWNDAVAGAFGALASAACSCEEDFGPYAKELLPALLPYIALPKPGELLPGSGVQASNARRLGYERARLRSKALECCGHSFLTLSDADAEAHAPALVEASLAYFENAHAAAPALAAQKSVSDTHLEEEMREHAHGLLEKVAQRMRHAFAPYLARAAASALVTMEQEEKDAHFELSLKR